MRTVKKWTNALKVEYEPNSVIPVLLTPLKQRYFRAVVYCLAALLTTRIYSGWQPFSEMLFRDGAYVWKCKDVSAESPGEATTGGEEIGIAKCREQYNAVQALFTIGNTAEFALSIFAGFMFDRFGPMATALAGEIGFVIGSLMLMYSSSSVQLYIPGMVLMAGCINFIAYPNLELLNMFPKQLNLVMASLLSMQGLSALIASLLNVVYKSIPEPSFRRIMWVYLSVIAIPTGCWYVLSLPLRREVSNLRKSTTFTEDVYNAIQRMSSKPSIRVDTQSDRFSVVEEPRQSPITTPSRNGDDEDESHIPHPDPVQLELSHESTCVAPSSKSVGVNYVKLLRELTSPEWILYCVVYTLQSLQCVYFTVAVRRVAGDKVATFMGWFFATMSFWTIVLGLLVEWINILILGIGTSGALALMYGLFVVDSANLQYFPSVICVIATPWISIAVYFYFQQIFSAAHFGTLLGVVACVRGLAGLVNIPLLNADENFGVSLTYLLLNIPCIIILAYLYRRYARGIRHL